jgi:hypothetical protein
VYVPGRVELDVETVRVDEKGGSPKGGLKLVLTF